MVHSPTFGPHPGPRQPRGVRATVRVLRTLIGLALATVAGCATDGGTQPGQLRFGQLGEVRVTVVSPLIVAQGGVISTQGELQQVFTWHSSGAWQIAESVFYQGTLGDEDVSKNPGNPAFYQGAYATLITHLNDTPALKLFGETLELEQNGSPDCFGDGRDSRSKVIVQLSDSVTDGLVRWTVCAEGTLEDLTPEGAGPDRDASRVVQAAVLARDFGLGERWESKYIGTLPYGTLDKGEGSKAQSLTQPRVFRLGSGVNASATAPAEFAAFWREHKGQDQAPPNVDWARQMVIAAAIGPVPEAGDSIEVRRIVEDGLGTTLVEFFERQPGDFCAPASRTQIPFHIVVAPRVTNLVRFGTPRIERVPCV